MGEKEWQRKSKVNGDVILESIEDMRERVFSGGLRKMTCTKTTFRGTEKLRKIRSSHPWRAYASRHFEGT